MDRDYPSIDALAEDYEFFGEPAPLLDRKILMDHGVATLAGAGGVLLEQAIFNMETVQNFYADKPGWAILSRLLLGIAGGRALYHFEGPGSHAATYGLVGAIAGNAAANGAMMLYNQYAAPAQAAAAPAPEGTVQGIGYTGVRQVAPYYDRYKVSVPRIPSNLSGEVVTRANYFQTNGIGEGEATAAADDQPGWPEMDETPDVGTWIG